MIESLPDPHGASNWCDARRAEKRTIGYVPTMGALHDGHFSLVERAVRENGVTCASIFVNPLQFNNAKDLEKYPKDLERDIALLDGIGCSMVYTGTLSQFFPEVQDISEIPLPDAGPASRGLEGAFRPGHLEGVRAIVERLFETVGPCRAYFGEKDFQQTLVIKDLVKGFPGIEVITCPTVREPYGLAMSSRNRRLNGEQKAVAIVIYQSLLAAREAWRRGVREAAPLEAMMCDYLRVKPVGLEYAAVRDPLHWTAETPHGKLRQARALVAAYVGDVRLIDNLALDTG